MIDHLPKKPEADFIMNRATDRAINQADAPPQAAAFWRRALTPAAHLARAWVADLRAHRIFWLLAGLIVLAAAALRTWRLDMPPFDFPADRQRSNCMLTQMMIDGSGLFSVRRAWLELFLLPWLTARTRWLAHWGHFELWTLARCWSALFGLLTVALVGWAGFLSAEDDPAAPAGRRRRIALLWMALLAFNPYHIGLSRMITTEALTLALQAAMVVCFWLAWRGPRRAGALALFLVFFIMSGWAKLPSLIWLPAVILCLPFHPALRGWFVRQWRIPRRRWWAGLGVALPALALAAALAAIFHVYQINPLHLYESYARRFALVAGQAARWLGSAPWTATYLSRLALMLTLPGCALAILGLLRAPWLYRLTVAVFLVLFYGLVNLNRYNFCHVILPGLALAAWGAELLLTAAVKVPGGEGQGRWGRWGRFAPWLGGGAVAALIIVGLYPLGPAAKLQADPRAEVTQAVQVIGRLVPRGTAVINDDGEGSLSYLLGQPIDTITRAFDLRTGWYYSIERFSDQPLLQAARAWVKWASLPGEPGGILFAAKAGDTPDAAAGLRRIPAGDSPASDTLAVASYLVPAAYEAGRNAIVVHPGQSFRLGIEWRSGAHASLAGMRWSLGSLRRYVPVPLREGGFASSFGGVLCLPAAGPATAFYTFEIPAGFPVGTLYPNVYPLEAGHWRSPGQGGLALPFNIIVEPAQASPPVQSQSWRELYPLVCDRAPLVWAPAWRYAGMRLEGYRTNSAMASLFSCPRRRPGVYRLTVEGEGEPGESSTNPAGVWPVVEVCLPAAPARPLARIALDRRRTGRFTAEFSAMEPFDALVLNLPLAPAAPSPPPRWRVDFIPIDAGRPVATVRRARLELVRPLLTGESVHEW